MRGRWHVGRRVVDLPGADGVTSSEAFVSFGLDPARIGDAALDPATVARLPRGAHRARAAAAGGGQAPGRCLGDHGRQEVRPEHDGRGWPRGRGADAA